MMIGRRGDNAASCHANTIPPQSDAPSRVATAAFDTALRSSGVMRLALVMRSRANRFASPVRRSHSNWHRGGFGRPEKHSTPGTELRLLPDHACGYTIDVGNVGAAEPKRIACAGLLLIRRVSACVGQKSRHENRHGQSKTDLNNSGSGHLKIPQYKF
jgi:hypothetical protein